MARVAGFRNPPVGAGFHPRPASDYRLRCGDTHGLRAAGAARKGGTPGEGPPFNPLLRFVSTGEFRALRRAARAPPLDPARFFVKKRGKKLLFGGTSAGLRGERPLSPSQH